MQIADYLATQPFAFALTALAFGLMVGSFLNVVIYRLPLMMQRDWEKQCVEFLAERPHWEVRRKPDAPPEDSAPFNLSKPDSHCPQCKREVRAWENIPVLSYLVLRGRCAGCGWRIPVRYPAIELVTGVSAALVANHFGFGWPALMAMLLTFALIALTMIDVDQMLLPDDITLPALWLGLVLNAWGTFTDLHSALIGAVAGYLVLWTIYWAFKLLTGKEGMGYGDFKLLAALGAWMGWQALPLIIILSSLVGAIYGVAAIALGGHAREKPIPFGPYLAVAGWIALLWGGTITDAYLQFSGIR